MVFCLDCRWDFRTSIQNMPNFFAQFYTIATVHFLDISGMSESSQILIVYGPAVRVSNFLHSFFLFTILKVTSRLSSL